MIKGSVLQGNQTVLNMYVLDNEASKYVKQKWAEHEEK